MLTASRNNLKKKTKTNVNRKTIVRESIMSATAKPKLKVYGTWVSQPCRAVMWLLEINSIPYEFVEASVVAPRSSPARQEYMKRISPIGRIPGFEDSENNVILYESAAILTYIATKYNLQDLYPNGTQSQSHLKRRALIDQYLHWHHENIRLITLSYIGPLMRVDVKIDKWLSLTGNFINQRKLLKYSLKVLNERYFGQHDYIVDNQLSVADILCYEEVFQLRKWEVLYPYSKLKKEFPNVDAWMTRMEKLKGHEKVHKIMDTLQEFVKKRVKDTEPLQKAIRSKL